MQDTLPLPERNLIPSPQASSEITSGDRIVVGNMKESVAAIGRGASVIYHQALTAADQSRAREDFEHQKLAEAVARLAGTLYLQLQDPPAFKGSPYKYLLPYEFADAWRFFGREEFRDEVVAAMTCFDSRCRLTMLHGDAGMGKTSLLRAALVPMLVAAGHLPLIVRVSDEPLANSIKRALIPNLNRLELLRDSPLRDFLGQVSNLLPEGKQVFVLVDQFEQFFDLPVDERQHFVHELGDCLYSSEEDRTRFLFSLRSAKMGYVSTFAPTIPQPLANSLVLPPLSPKQARSAILDPAALAGLKVEGGLVDTLLEDLGSDAVDPSRLQLVCHTLALGLEQGEATLTIAEYNKLGRLQGIFRDHLSLVLSRNLPPEDRELAWQILSSICDKPGGALQKEVLQDLQDYRVGPERTLEMVKTLEDNRLIRMQENRHFLASGTLAEPIRQWAAQRAALEQARVETRRQFQRFRDSAMRGLLGGGGGFMLAYLLTFGDQTVDWLVLPFVALYEALLGAVAGIVFIFALDIAFASFHGKRRWMHFPWGGLAGAIAFAPAMLFHALLQFPANEVQVLLTAIEGALWGLVAGLSTVAVLLSSRPRWQTVLPLAVLNGLTFWATEQIGHAYHRPRIPVGGEFLSVRILLVGALLFIALVAAALWRTPAGGEPRRPRSRFGLSRG